MLQNDPKWEDYSVEEQEEIIAGVIEDYGYTRDDAIQYIQEEIKRERQLIAQRNYHNRLYNQRM